jgi:hypothetical protein
VKSIRYAHDSTQLTELRGLPGWTVSGHEPVQIIIVVVVVQERDRDILVDKLAEKERKYSFFLEGSKMFSFDRLQHGSLATLFELTAFISKQHIT